MLRICLKVNSIRHLLNLYKTIFFPDCANIYFCPHKTPIYSSFNNKSKKLKINVHMGTSLFQTVLNLHNDVIGYTESKLAI